MALSTLVAVCVAFPIVVLIGSIYRVWQRRWTVVQLAFVLTLALLVSGASLAYATYAYSGALQQAFGRR